MGDGGEVVIPKDMRERLGIQPGDDVTFETRPDGVVILPRNGGGRGQSGRGGRSASSRSGRSTSSRSSGRSSGSSTGHRHAERTDDCF